MPALSRFRALTFDCYGTLIDWESGLLAVLRPWAARASVPPSDDQLLEAFAAAESRRKRDLPTLLYPDILRLVHADVTASLGLAPAPTDADVLASSVGEWLPFPDTPAALQSLKKRFKLVIVSNVDRASFARTNQRLGVEFDAVITAEDVRSYKPALPHFHSALETLASMGIEKSRVLHVAQSLYHDHVPAKSIGLATAWINRRRGKPGAGATPVPPFGVAPDFTFASMRELAEAVEHTVNR